MLSSYSSVLDMPCSNLYTYILNAILFFYFWKSCLVTWDVFQLRLFFLYLSLVARMYSCVNQLFCLSLGVHVHDCETNL